MSFLGLTARERRFGFGAPFGGKVELLQSLSSPTEKHFLVLGATRFVTRTPVKSGATARVVPFREA